MYFGKEALTNLPSVSINTAQMCFMQLLQGLFIATLVLSPITVISGWYKTCTIQAGLWLFIHKRACTVSHSNSLFSRLRVKVISFTEQELDLISRQCLAYFLSQKKKKACLAVKKKS